MSSASLGQGGQGGAVLGGLNEGTRGVAGNHAVKQSAPGGRSGAAAGLVGKPMLSFIMAELREQVAQCQANGSGGGHPQGQPSLELAELLAAVQAAVKAVAATLRSSGLIKWRSTRDIAAEIFVNYITSSHSVALLVCDDKVIPVEAGGERRGKYVVCVSPLDTKQDTPDPPSIAGTVFSVHRYQEPSRGSQQGVGHGLLPSRPSLRSALQPGRNLVAAGYALYASSTLLVLSTGPGVHLFALDPVLGEFILTAPNLTIPDRGHIYSVDEGLTYEWGDPVVEYVESKKDPKLGATYGSHHVGCVVADVHTVLRNGGIYLAPQTRTQPNGKLRLVLEAAPLAHLVCRAGGLATDGHGALTDCQPEGLAHRTPAFLGSRDDVRDLLALFRRNSVGSTLYSARPSSLRAGSAGSATACSATVAANTTSRAGSQHQKPKDRTAAAEAELTASMAALSATIVALGGVRLEARPEARPPPPSAATSLATSPLATASTSSRPASAVYPSSTGSLLGLVPSVQRPASAAPAPTSSSSGVGGGLGGGSARPARPAQPIPRPSPGHTAHAGASTPSLATSSTAGLAFVLPHTIHSASKRTT